MRQIRHQIRKSIHPSIQSTFAILKNAVALARVRLINYVITVIDIGAETLFAGLLYTLSVHNVHRSPITVA